MEEEIIKDLKEIAHYFGGWDELRKQIDRLEADENEEAGMRALTEPEAWEGGFAENH